MDDNPYRSPPEPGAEPKPRLRWRFRRSTPYLLLLWLVLFVVGVAIALIGSLGTARLAR